MWGNVGVDRAVSGRFQVGGERESRVHKGLYVSNCCVHVFVLHMLVGIGLAVNGLPVYMFNN